MSPKKGPFQNFQKEPTSSSSPIIFSHAMLVFGAGISSKKNITITPTEIPVGSPKWRVSRSPEMFGYVGGGKTPVSISRKAYSLYRWGFLHFRYLKSLVTGWCFWIYLTNKDFEVLIIYMTLIFWWIAQLHFRIQGFRAESSLFPEASCATTFNDWLETWGVLDTSSSKSLPYVRTSVTVQKKVPRSHG